MKTLKTALFAAFTLLTAGAGQAQKALNADPSGTYLSESGETRVRIARCGPTYCGIIVAVQGEAKDVNNPDASLRDRNLVGVRMISDIQPEASGTGFAGQLYNYKDGKTYSGTLALLGKGDSLKLSGCVLGGLICRSQIWTRVAP